ncbi:unnamed protein product [Amoebophrya sp. A25]|nr:unnamed protein product [Amoebophrya sp. A25]|eukprot:GSA25T00022525001.1
MPAYYGSMAYRPDYSRLNLVESDDVFRKPLVDVRQAQAKRASKSSKSSVGQRIGLGGEGDGRSSGYCDSLATALTVDRVCPWAVVHKPKNLHLLNHPHVLLLITPESLASFHTSKKFRTSQHLLLLLTYLS